METYIPPRLLLGYMVLFCLLSVVLVGRYRGTAAVLYLGPSTMARQQRIAQGLLYTPSKPKKTHYTHYHPLTRTDIASVEKFLFFTGYPRSGHSIVGSLIDAHPNILLSYSYFLFSHLVNESSFPRSRAVMFETIHHKSYTYSINSPRMNNKGYTLDVPGSWSGRLNGSLRIIGDKSAKATTDVFNSLRNPKKFKQIYNKLRSLVRVPLLVLHVVRNPFDMIATRTLYRLSRLESGRQVKANYTENNKLNNTELITQMARKILKMASAVADMVPLCNMTVMEIHNEDLIRDPATVVTEICNFLGVACPVQYVDACVEKVFPVVSRTRDKVVWPSKLRAWIEREMNKYPFFQRYTFED